MKKFSKILSSVLATSMVVSAFAMNAFAASKAHTMTIAASKTEGLVAGEEITVTVSLDNTKTIQSLGYRLVFDTDAFEIDRTKGWESDEDFDSHENFIDKDWYDSVLTNVWGKRLTTFKYGYDDPAPGCITLGWTGSAVPDSKAVDNYVLGVFKFTVKEDVADGKYQFTIDTENSSTTDTGENFGAPITCEAVTVKVGEDAPAKTAPEVGIETGTVQGPSGKWAAGILGTVNFDPAKNTTFSTIEITPNNGTVDAKEPVVFTVADGTVFESAVTVKCALNITKCPDQATAEAITAKGIVK